ncbi:carbohydrate-binding family 9-like protein [Ulvibacterium marinum]|nr:carbohydrate-binding family 9-like protein [Ulvibacterium marinum]
MYHPHKCALVSLVFIFTGVAVAVGQNVQKLSLGEQSIFEASKTNQKIVVDGKLNEEVWQRTEARTLDYFYRIEQQDDEQKTTFRMLWDEQNIYLFYQMEDKFLTVRETRRDGEPYLDDCAEIFFITAPDSLDTHFGYELNLNKASNDFIYFNRYYKGKDVVYKTFNPEFKVEITYDGTINDNSDIDKGWTMEMAIPISNFGELGEIEPIQKGTHWAILAVRQDRNDLNGNRRSTSTLFPIYDISKNVHQANRFGLVEFIE